MSADEQLKREDDEEAVPQQEERPLSELREAAELNAGDDRTEDAFEAQKIRATESPRIEDGEPKPIDQR